MSAGCALVQDCCFLLLGGAPACLGYLRFGGLQRTELNSAAELCGGFRVRLYPECIVSGNKRGPRGRVCLERLSQLLERTGVHKLFGALKVSGAPSRPTAVC